MTWHKLYYFDTFDERVSKVTWIITWIQNSTSLYKQSNEWKNKMFIDMQNYLYQEKDSSIFICNYLSWRCLLKILEYSPELADTYKKIHKTVLYTCLNDDPSMKQLHKKYNWLWIIEYSQWSFAMSSRGLNRLKSLIENVSV